MRCSTNGDVRKFATPLAFINQNARSRLSCESPLNISCKLENRSNQSAFRFYARGWFLRALTLCFFCSLAGANDSPLLIAAIIRGADTYSTLQLLPAYQKHLGKPITNPVIEDIAASINKLYISDGFTPPQMRLDSSQLDDGILGIDVYEAQITSVAVSGDQGPYADEIARARDELLAMKPLRSRDLQTQLRRLRELPGLTLNVTTRRDGDHRSGYVLVIEAAFDRVEAQLRLTNRGTRDVGRGFAIAQAAINGLFERDLKAGAVLGLAESKQEFRGAGIFAEAPIASDLRATLLGFRSLSDPTEMPLDWGVEYLRNRASLTIADGWRRWGAVELKTSGIVELDDMYIDHNGVRLQSDRERVLSVSSQLLWSGSQTTQYLTQLTVRRGVDAFGAGLVSAIPLDDGRDAAFTVASAQIVRVARILPQWQLRLDLLAQYSNDVLADRERFKIGGDHLGRGFEVPAITGDRGLGGKVEIRRELPKFNTRLGNLSTYAYYDLGAAWTNPSHERHSAASAAAGLSLHGKRLFASLELARPLTHADLDGHRRNTVFVEAVATF
jgi:hemolysin activation/secretion protein